MPSTSKNSKTTPPKKGLIFAVTQKGKDEIFGVIAKDDVTVGPMNDAFLVYLFKPAIKDIAAQHDVIDVNSLYLPPIITDISPWKKGLFQAMGAAPQLPRLDSIAPTFKHPLNSRLFTIDGVPTDVESPLTGEWAVWTHTGIKEMLEGELEPPP